MKLTASGTKRDGRKELSRLLQIASKGDTIVITRIDPLARSMKDLQDIVHELKTKGVALKATQQPIDPSNANFGRLALTRGPLLFRFGFVLLVILRFFVDRGFRRANLLWNALGKQRARCQRCKYQ